jgi:hypothetical protein
MALMLHNSPKNLLGQRYPSEVVGAGNPVATSGKNGSELQISEFSELNIE